MQPVDKKYWDLRNHQLFDQLSPDEVSSLCIITRYKEAKKNELIFFTSEAENRIFILKQGVVKILTTDESGETTVKDVVKAGDLFGELPNATAAGGATEYAQAASESVVICTFRVEEFEALLEQKPILALRYSRMVGKKLRTLEQKYHSLMFKDVRTRLLEFIARYTQEFARPDDQPWSARNHLKQDEIAALVGTSRQTAASTLIKLQEEGLIRYTRTHISLLERGRAVIMPLMSAS